MNCPFCNPDENLIIKNGEGVFVIMSNPRLMPGHLLVVSKRHVEKISELNTEEKKELFDMLVEYQEKILSQLAKGCDIRQNYRPFQTPNNLKIDHLHIHFLPREFEDELYKKCQVFEKDIFKKLSEEEIKNIRSIFGK